ncbi:MAG: MCP four helix bundle domain-containing protein [Chloroflexi bacterium]|nr:MCP four helix bundle domain-containing protein [Chloroflexota bacterium]
MKWFNRLRVRTRFLLIALFILPFLTGLGGAGVWGVLQINNILQEEQANQTPSVYDLSQVITQIQSARMDYYQALLETDPSKLQQLVSSVKAHVKLARDYWETYRQLPSVPGERALWPQFEATWKDWVSEVNEIGNLALLNTPQARQQRIELLAINPGDQLVEAVSQMSAVDYNGAIELNNTAQQTFVTVLIIIIVSAIGVVLVCLAAGLVLAHSIIGMTTELTFLNQQINAAWFSSEGKRHFGEEVSLRLKAMTTELHATSSQQTSGSQQQVFAINEITTTLTELAQTAQTVATGSTRIDQAAAAVLASTQQVTTATSKASQVGEHGQQAMEKTLHASYQVNNFYQVLLQFLAELDQQSGRVKEVISLMRDISNETHLLALNASIEAAGAGEQGSRFAVVARSIKELADRSMKASREVSLILNGLQTRTRQAVVTAEEGQRDILTGVTVAQETGTVINELVVAIKISATEVEKIQQAVVTMKGWTQEISSITRQQYKAVSHSANALQDIDIVARQTAAGSVQVSASMQDLEELSHQLNLALAA